MLTVGVDLSSVRAPSWVAVVSWDAHRAELVDLRSAVADVEIVDMAADPEIDKIGIDAPLGWPTKLVDCMHDPLGAVHTDQDQPELELMEYRLTEIRLKQLTPDLRPPSLVRDGIGRAAMHCALLQWQFRQAGVPLDRAGISGPIVEVHPPASLYPWHLTFTGYKGPSHGEVLRQMVEGLGSPNGPSYWLSLGRWRDDCAENHRAFDALIGALTARATCVGRTNRPETDRELAVARTEGWIHVPTVASLPGLAEDSLAYVV